MASAYADPGSSGSPVHTDTDSANTETGLTCEFLARIHFALAAATNLVPLWSR